MGSGEFTRCILTQRSEFSIVQSQRAYAQEIQIAKTRRSAPTNAVALSYEVHNHISAQGNWLADQTRPDLSCQISFAQQIMPNPTVGQIRKSNAWVRRAKQFADLSVTFHNIPPEELRFVCHSDYSSKDLDGTGRTQAGYIIGAIDSTMAQGAVAQWGPLVWKSQKLKQGCTSTLAGEGKDVRSALGHLEWIMCTFAAAWFPRFCFKTRETDLRRFSSITVIDCKSVFDFVTTPGAPTRIGGKRCAIHLAIVKGFLKRMGATLRWGPTSLMLGDALTKDWAEATDVSRACLRAGAYQLADESTTLERAQAEKAARAQPQAAQQATGSPCPVPPPRLQDG